MRSAKTVRSLILTTYNRDHLLKLTLPRIREYFDDEIVIVNDGVSKGSEALAKTYNCKYIFMNNKNWRCPAIALNTGVAASSNPIVVLSCAEIYHKTDLLNHMTPDKMEMVITNGKDDTGVYLAYIQRRGQSCPEAYDFLPKLNTKLPFCMAIQKSLYTEIGGYDEDFTGQGYDDDDFVTRLLDLGCTYRVIRDRIVHLYHTRGAPTRNRRALEYNHKLFNARRGIIVRNNHVK